MLFEGKVEDYLDTTTSPPTAPPRKARAKPGTPAALLQDDPKGFFAQVADLIEERGWITGEMQNLRGEVCLVGAIAITLSYRVRDGKLYTPSGRRVARPASVMRAIRLLGFSNDSDAVEWNDDTCEEAADVLGLLRSWRPK